MPRFLKRIFTDNINPFRREQSPPDEVQRTRRVLVRSSTGSTHRLSFFEPTLHMQGNAAPRDGASIADSSVNRPMLAPSLADHEQSIPAQKHTRARRRLSKRQRAPA
ncbi:hypothetical protein HBI56_053070 [Parastagonospora nodorum]|uniref:Uncharacterized protein n=2 Tax=Phaeosphaeria nodorum (strain SN15 / ATCC MYA-4574 / FGSC 10173) TaxID=321614 RepID=Q0U4Y3_PHANO|nr:hypothetical protein SNOG_13181 [Parastagonospora nodorum SN15]KAH3914127.1 hypothetical protein HBH56_099090 [Parastagonospora nodorum]EAT79508.2 hypothetical protein SNOG_13181 [Parastagonospora nodorum SN15]KAH3930116.1 hypothetical protein HBH54_113410 [Parastagonospora nodorum]KAH4070273.1 hypothetical protein HBH50_096640 [Parastagonospora nodorum]KAH4090838.1 hypothetical protein HBH48_100410 [Parastagonospora nodorum]